MPATLNAIDPRAGCRSTLDISGALGSERALSTPITRRVVGDRQLTDLQDCRDDHEQIENTCSARRGFPCERVRCGRRRRGGSGALADARWGAAGRCRNLVHGAMFTRGPKNLRYTAISVGGSNVQAAEQVFRAVTECFFGPMRVSILFDANGSNTTAAAAVLVAATKVNLADCPVTVLGATGPVGQRAVRLLALEGRRSAWPHAAKHGPRTFAARSRNVIQQLG